MHHPVTAPAAAARVILAAAALLGAAQASASEVERRLVEVGGGRAELLAAGAGAPTVVFVPAMGSPAEDWRGVLGRVAPCVRAVAWSRPGLGASGPPPDAPVDAVAAAELLRAVLAAAGLPPPYLLVGHSLGGLHAQAFVRTFPEEVAGLVLVDAVMPNEPDGVFAGQAVLAPGSAAFFEDAGEAWSRRRLMSLPVPDVPVVALTATDHRDSPEREALWRKLQAEGAAAFPRGVQIVVPGAGHFIHHDRPDAVPDALGRLLPERTACLAGAASHRL
jgi:pimeloyl-ACP methyl ester carboxylesterase